jgi:Zn-dependent oligopeptidase
VLKLRNEKAELLGFKNFAELSMASKVRLNQTHTLHLGGSLMQGEAPL